MNSNKIAKYDARGSVVVADPFAPDGYHDTPEAVIKSMTEKRDAVNGEFNALGDITTAPLAAVKAVRRMAEDADEMAKSYKGELMNALLDLSGFKAVVVQLQGAKARIDPLSVRGKFAEIIKVCKEREDAEREPAPKHTYFYAVTATDDEHAAIQKIIKKADEGFGVVAPQKDAEWKVAAKLFGINN